MGKIHLDNLLIPSLVRIFASKLTVMKFVLVFSLIFLLSGFSKALDTNFSEGKNIESFGGMSKRQQKLLKKKKRERAKYDRWANKNRKQLLSAELPKQAY